MTIIERLKTHPVLRALPPAALRTLSEASTVRRLAAREILYRYGTPADRAFLLVEGLVRVYQVGPDDREVTVTNLLPPNLFGDNVLVAEDAGAPPKGYPENTMALKPTTLIEIQAASYLTVLKGSPAMSLELLRDVCCRFNAAAFREVDVMLSVPVRLASLLLSYADLNGIVVPEGIRIQLPLTHRDLADGLGVTTKSVARALGEWSEMDLIAKKKGWLIIRDASALRTLCGQGLLSHVYLYEPEKPHPRTDPHGSSNT
ncbi:MAG: Crp/Fnr family transcriptional regulator [Deltaproteobacteria bacterium]|nr:Crp/Fnr family transcriptional regulator [Deltaproteobacteria bacterium]